MSNTKKKKRPIIVKIFSKTNITFLVLFLELAFIVLFSFVFTISDILNIAYYVIRVLIIVLMLYLSNSKMDINYRITWLLLIALLPIFGSILYLMFANKKYSKKEINSVVPIVDSLNNLLDSPDAKGYGNSLTPEDGDLYTIANYIKDKSYTDIYKNTKTTYFPWGELAFPVMLEKLKNAKHYIFLEYFIIEEGKMWDPILEILKQKASEGLDVRVVYDDFGCLGTLPSDYDKVLRSYNIKCYRYEKLRPILDVRMNNRDHRKILVIDGHTGFTGGINLADEYINEKIRFGKWKDNAIMLEGEAVFGLTSLFLANWDVSVEKANKTNSNREEFNKYLPSVYANEVETPKNCSGFVQAYGSVPYIYETIGMNVYEMLLMKAKKYVYISTPYLILNDNMRNAICLAAKSGVDVRILTPHIPDKKIVFCLTRSNYKPLLEAGVKIFEYTPGFVHEKVFVVDDIMATVGTINLDYRSLFLHLENGTFLYKCDCIKEIKEDFDDTLLVSTEWTIDDIDHAKWYVKVARFFIGILAPLL